MHKGKDRFGLRSGLLGEIHRGKLGQGRTDARIRGLSRLARSSGGPKGRLQEEGRTLPAGDGRRGKAQGIRVGIQARPPLGLGVRRPREEDKKRKEDELD